MLSWRTGESESVELRDRTPGAEYKTQRVAGWKRGGRLARAPCEGSHVTPLLAAGEVPLADWTRQERGERLADRVRW